MVAALGESYDALTRRRENTMARNATCIHRWILGEPGDAGIEAHCRRCGAQRTYPSGIEPPEEEQPAAVPDFSAVIEVEDVNLTELARELASSRGYALV